MSAEARRFPSDPRDLSTVLLNAIVIYSVTSSTPQSSSFDVEAINPTHDPCSTMAQATSSPFIGRRSVSSAMGPKRPSASRSQSFNNLGLHRVDPAPPSIALTLDAPLRPRPDRGLGLDLRYEEEDDNSPRSVEYLDELRMSYLSTTTTSGESTFPRPNDKSDKGLERPF